MRTEPKNLQVWYTWSQPTPISRPSFTAPPPRGHVRLTLTIPVAVPRHRRRAPFVCGTVFFQASGPIVRPEVECGPPVARIQTHTLARARAPLKTFKTLPAIIQSVVVIPTETICVIRYTGRRDDGLYHVNGIYTYIGVEVQINRCTAGWCLAIFRFDGCVFTRADDCKWKTIHFATLAKVSLPRVGRQHAMFLS